MQAVRHVDHSVKGTAASFGANRMGELAHHIEQHLRKDERHHLGELVDGLTEEFGRVRAPESTAERGNGRRGLP